MGVSAALGFQNFLKVETVPDDPVIPLHKHATRFSTPANDNGRTRRMRAKVLIARNLPVTQAEVEVFALLVDDLAGFATNDNEG
jgi:hypothetical protein